MYTSRHFGIVTRCCRDWVHGRDVGNVRVIQTQSQVLSFGDRDVALITKRCLQISLVTRTRTCRNCGHEQRRPREYFPSANEFRLPRRPPARFPPPNTFPAVTASIGTVRRDGQTGGRRNETIWRRSARGPLLIEFDSRRARRFGSVIVLKKLAAPASPRSIV